MLLVIGYALCWRLAWEVSTPHWFLPAGLRFAGLWLLQPRRWSGLLLAELLAVGSLAAGATDSGQAMAAALPVFVPWVAMFAVVAALRPPGPYAAPETPARMAATLATMLCAAVLAAVLHYAAGRLTGSLPAEGALAAALRAIIGDYVGMLMLAPIAFQLASPRPPGVDRRRMMAELGLLFLPLLAVLLGLVLWLHDAAAVALLLSVAPMMLMSFRHGWRGAAWALGATSLTLHFIRLRVDLPLAADLLQMFLALVGSIALLLGAAIGSLQRLNAALIERNRQEMAANARLSMQAGELRDLGQRLARAREEEQSRLAHELHDELGQMIAALRTRLVLLARKTDDPEMIAALNAQRELVHRMSGSLREVLHGLRPAVLDRFGLEAALREGPLQRLLADAGTELVLEISGPIWRIGPDAASAIYRLSQETATNCIKHAQARTFRLALDIAPTWDGSLEIHLRIEDDGRGFDRARVEREGQGSGLRGIRDRVLAMGGESHCESGASGTRHTIWFIDRQPRVSEPAGSDSEAEGS